MRIEKEPALPLESEQDASIIVEHLEKSFPIAYGLGSWVRNRGKVPRRTVLHDITLSVRRGELLGLLGPNGAGKTTLLKLLATLSVLDRGKILIEGIDAARDPAGAKRCVGLCTSEERSFYFRLTARANLAFFGALLGLRGRTLAQRITEVSALVDLTEELDQRFDSYSSGMRQRLTVARALMGDPDVILLDEPTRAVDPVHAEEIRRIIRDELVIRRGKTVVLATNLLDEAWRLCDRVAVINKGRLVAVGEPRSLDKLLRQVLRYEIEVEYLDEVLLSRTRAIPGVSRAETKPSEGGVTLKVEIDPGRSTLTDLLRMVTTNGTQVRGIKFIEPLPFEVFSHVTADKQDA
jgi:ABC-2 type transport system ATP-binding protein